MSVSTNVTCGKKAKKRDISCPREGIGDILAEGVCPGSQDKGPQERGL